MNIEKLKELLALDEKVKKAAQSLVGKYREKKEDAQKKCDAKISDYNSQLSQKDKVVEEKSKALCGEAEKEIKAWHKKEEAKLDKMDSGKLTSAKNLIEKRLAHFF